MPRCTATARTGKRCKHNQVDGSLFCTAHKKMNENNDVATTGDGWEGIDELLSEAFDDVPDVVETSDATISLNMIAPPPIQQTPVPTLNIDDMLEEITLKMEKLNKVKRILKTANSEVDSKAKWMFYHTNKTNPDLVGDIRTKLQSCGLYLIKNNKEVLPYRFVKEYTDNSFNAMPQQEKEAYYNKARMNIMGKVHMAQRLLMN